MSTARNECTRRVSERRRACPRRVEEGKPFNPFTLKDMRVRGERRNATSVIAALETKWQTRSPSTAMARFLANYSRSFLETLDLRAILHSTRYESAIRLRKPVSLLRERRRWMANAKSVARAWRLSGNGFA